MYVIKKDGTKEEFNVHKIIAAVNKSASRIMYRFTENEIAFICEYAKEKAKERQQRRHHDSGDAQHCGGRPGQGQSRCGQELPRLPELQAGLYPHDG